MTLILTAIGAAASVASFLTMLLYILPSLEDLDPTANPHNKVPRSHE